MDEPAAMTELPADLPDQELLRMYASSRSQEAFSRIVDRHAPMVLQTAFRVVGNRQEAEDVSQAVFLILSERAGTVTHTLGGWLHKVTRDAALQALRSKARRARREEAAVRSKSMPDAALEQDLRKDLDQAVVKLPDRLREAVVLRYLEGRSQEEAAQMAACDKATLSRRCTQGLTRLAALLSGGGVAVAPSLLAGFLDTQAPASVSAATLAILQGVGAGGGSASAQVLALAKGTLKAMFWAKAKVLAAVFGVVTTVTAAGVGLPVVLSHPPAAPAREVLLRYDFEDGRRPALCTTGKVVAGPESPGSRFCVESDPTVFLQKEGGLFTYTEDTVLVLDLWLEPPLATVDFHFWNETQHASFGWGGLRVPPRQWGRGLVVRLSDFHYGSGAPKPGDRVSNFSIKRGEAGGRMYVDNLEFGREGGRRPPELK
jgi:RNA polymerase sigma factor (sigma-70 family)